MIIVSNEMIDFNDVDIVIVSTKGAYDNVKKQLELYDLKVIDLLEQVGI